MKSNCPYDYYYDPDNEECVNCPNKEVCITIAKLEARI